MATHRVTVGKEWPKIDRDLTVVRSTVVDPASIAAGATGETDVTVTGAAVGMGVVAQPPALTAGLVIALVRVKATDTVTIRLYNPTGGAIDEPSGTWKFWLVS